MSAGSPHFRGGFLSTAANRSAKAWPEAAALLETRTAQVDAAALGAWNEHLARAAPEGVALVAVGGFGRREQFPHSDVDLLLLTTRPALGDRERAAFAEFLKALWDAGLRVSQSVHTPADCCELGDDNLEFVTSLLSHRFLAGDRGVYARLHMALPRFLHSQRQTLARRLAKTARARHARHGGSIYQLEPNIKEGPGGLRDLQLAGWLDQLRTVQPDRLMPAAVSADLLPARDFLFALRWWLHSNAGRDMNTLTFDLEEEAAELFGAGAADWMRQYYAQAREIWRAALRAVEAAEEQGSTLLAQFRDWRSRVSNADFHVSRERVYFRAPLRLEHEPPLLLSLFEFVARHGIRLAPDTERRIAGHLPRLRRFFAESQAVLWPAFRAVLAGPHAALALRAMNDTGAMAAIFPEWERIDCLVVRDFYHRYTVDEHTLVAIEQLKSLTDKRFGGLLAETGDLPLLRFALLFHDLGKAAATGRHVAASLQFAEAAMERIQMPATDRRGVRLLIGAHLDLSAAMMSRDLDDPAVARALAERAGTLEDLQRLTLLTYADISAVNPGAMTEWRRDQLWRVYLALHHELTRELASDRIQAPPPEAGEFVEGFPIRYLRTHTPEQIRLHEELERRSRERGVAVDLSHEGGYWRLTLVAQDRPALLASVAGALAAFGMNILKAEGFANRRGTVLDVFVFSDPHHTLVLNPTEVDRLRLILERVTLGRTDVRSLLEGRPKPARGKRQRIRPAVTFDQSASESATLVEIVAEDRPGLLYTLAAAISAAGANIELVLIDTEGHKAVDVFYLTRDGRKLTSAEEAALRDAFLGGGL